MRRFVLSLLCCLLLIPGVQAESTATTQAEETPLFAWTLQVGDSGQTIPTDMCATETGGVYIVGHTNGQDDALGDGFGETDGFVMRIGASGDLLWWRRLGGSGQDVLHSVVPLADGGCLALGTTTSRDGDASAARGQMDAWLVRLSRTGETVYTKNLGGSRDDELVGLLVGEDDTILAYGRTQSYNGDLRANNGGWDAWATLLSLEDGKPLWIYRAGDTGDDTFTKAIVVSATEWLLLGEQEEKLSESSEGVITYIGRPIVQIINRETGETAFEAPVQLGDSGTNILTDVIRADSGWMLAGVTNSRSALMPPPHGGRDIWMLQVRPSGSVARQFTYGGSRDERLSAIHAMPGGGYILLCETDSSDDQVAGAHGGGDVWILRLTSAGALEWQQALGGSDVSTVCGMLLREDGGLLVSGTTLSQDGDIGRHASLQTGFLSWLAPNGNLERTRTVTDADECTLVSMLSHEGVGYLLGVVHSVDASGPVKSVWLSRLEEDGFAGW